MRNTLKKRIISGFMVLSIIISTIAPGVMAFGEENQKSSLYEIMSETTDTAEVTVLSSSKKSEIEVATDSDADVEVEEGLEVLEKYIIDEREEDSDEKIWIKAEQDENLSLKPEESIAIYSVEEDKVEDLIIEDIAEEEDPCELEEDVTEVALVKDSGYRHLNFEITPTKEKVFNDGSEGVSSIEDKTVILDGMMPKEATAEAKDVTEEYSSSDKELASESDSSVENEFSEIVNASITDASSTDESWTPSVGKTIAAYDITIKDGETEYQPSTDRPIEVIITDYKILSDSNLRIFHIKDNGEKEEITDFTLEEGKVSFSATGFSVYEIVEGPEKFNPLLEAVTSKDELVGNRAKGGFYLCYGKKPLYFSNNVNGKGALVEVGNYDEAAVWYFEEDGTNYKIYTYINGVKKYIHTKSGNSIELSGKADAITISEGAEDVENAFYFKKSSEDRWLQHSGSGDGIRYYTDNNNTENSNIKLYYADKVVVPDDYYGLNGKTYGLMNYNTGTHGYALMGDDTVHSLVELVTHQEGNSNNQTLYVDEGSEVTRWTFKNVKSDLYTLSATVGGSTKYISVSGDSLIMVDSETAAESFKVVPSSNNRIQLKSGNKYINLITSGEGDNATRSFELSENSSDSSMFALIDFAHLTEDDLITYSADRISISDVENGQKVIIYTRIWNEDDKKYDMFAVDCDGSLYPVYASGGKILWLGDGTGTLEWEFTEYYHEVTKQPNGYYELYNPYSEKYLAPQITNNQVLSDETIGINLNGRRNGDFYSEIVAWDDTRYAYIGLKPNEAKTKLVPCSQSTSIPFYFATLEELNLSDKLHEVPTVDNNEFGITMKMFDFEGDKNNLKDADVTKNYFDGDYSNTQGLLKNSLTYVSDDAGYPSVKSNGKSFKDLYSGAKEVNHLFIQSVYNSSGYFEFDSCQNFATLNGNTGGDFTVYRELGTTNDKTKATLQHGQFYPYNTIKAGKYSSASPQNLYNMDALASNPKVGKLDESDPRKYEKLLLIDNPNYFFGMEMSANFVQTVSGLDAWGHDIIFDFTGDDDFWLFVDGELVIDLGGTHSAEHGRVNFKTGEITYSLVTQGNDARTEKHTTLVQVFRDNYKSRGMSDSEIEDKISEIFDLNEDNQYIFRDYSTHTMRAFYMERGAGASNLHMRFNLAAVTPGNVVISKNISGEGADLLDKDFLEYPFQIYYKVPDVDGEILLGNDNENINVNYQNSNQPVTFVDRYRPPGVSEEDAYQNVYFINPTKNAEISFPDNAISYRIVECAVDTSVYKDVYINGERVPDEQKEIKGNLISYSSQSGSVEQKPVIAFDNIVNDNVIKNLIVTKKVYDDEACEHELDNVPATFNFRLYLSSIDIDADDMQRVNMYKYFVLSPDKKLCYYDSGLGTFASTGIDYSYENIKKALEGKIEGYEIDDLVFRTSPAGQISGIPANYSICVPGLPVGSLFKITEENTQGYGLAGYDRVMGDKTISGEVQQLPSYEEYDGNPLNVGRVIGEFDSQMIVKNRKGYGLTVNKKWSDLDITTSHDAVYVAVYVDGNLLEGSIKQIKSPNTSAYYFWTTLLGDSEGNPRSDLTGYVVKEVKLEGDFEVDEDNTVIPGDSLTVTPYNNNAEISDLGVTRISSATPKGESPEASYDYIVTYDKGISDGATREDVINNTRKGGIKIRLFKWDSIDPLSGGVFKLKDENGNVVGTYTSNSEGTVTILYNLEKNKNYTITQSSAPNGYVGIQKDIVFKLNDDETVSLYYSDGSSWGLKDTDDNKWANHQLGTSGISAFIDIYNKPFNFKIEKMDNEDSTLMLSGAHFALYKQANTTINGYEKNKYPMDGFEDFETVNGVVYVCGGDSGRIIKPGKNGGIFFLTEIQAPNEYTKLKDDIVFSISPIGVPTLISDSYKGNLVEEDDCYKYTLSVPNSKDKSLVIKKMITGNMGNRSKEFVFTFNVINGDAATEYSWKLNGTDQSEPLKAGDKFRLSHNDEVEITVPKDTEVKISEDPANYRPSYKLGEADVVEKSFAQFVVDDDKEIVFTNTCEAILPTGVWNAFGLLIASGIGLIIVVILLVVRNKRLKKYTEE